MQAALALVNSLVGADKDVVVDLLVKAHVATSDTAMEQTIKKAAEMLTALENTPWELFETLRRLPAEYAQQARAIEEQVTNAVTRDEHVLALAGALKERKEQRRAQITEAWKQPLSLSGPSQTVQAYHRPHQCWRLPAPDTACIGRTRWQCSSHHAAETDANLVLDLDWRYTPGAEAEMTHEANARTGGNTGRPDSPAAARSQGHWYYHTRSLAWRHHAQVNGTQCPVAFCTSVLQMCEALTSHAETSPPLVIVTPLDEPVGP